MVHTTATRIYSVRKGLLYAHNGQLVLKQNPKNLGRADVSDLDKDPVVVWQHNHYMLAPSESPGKSSRRRHLVAIIWVCSRPTSFKRTARGRIQHILLQEQLLDTV